MSVRSNVRSVRYPFGQMSVRQNVRSVRYSFGQMSVGHLSSHERGMARWRTAIPLKVLKAKLKMKQKREKANIMKQNESRVIEGWMGRDGTVQNGVWLQGLVKPQYRCTRLGAVMVRLGCVLLRRRGRTCSNYTFPSLGYVPRQVWEQEDGTRSQHRPVVQLA